MLYACLIACCLQQTPQSVTPILPPALRPGDTVALVSPASPPDEAAVVRMRTYLQKRGFRVKVSLGYKTRANVGYLAGQDDTRAAELNAMFANRDVRAIFCMRGGYGSPRILDKLDYRLIRANPKILVGYSDITGLLNAIQARTGLVGFHGPMSGELGAVRGPLAFTETSLWNALLEDKQKASRDILTKVATPLVKTLVAGKATGRLVGGNLSLLVSTLGTPYEFDARDAILFIEEVGEEPYRVDRMLNQLRLAGKLSQLRGIVLGKFTRCNGNSGPASLATVISHYVGDLGIPVISNVPAGHVPDQVTLPIGAEVSLDAASKRLTLIQPAVKTSRAGS